MNKKCGRCGSEMDVTLRTVYFSNTKFNNVPVYSCTHCNHNELVDYAKNEIKKLIVESKGDKNRKEIQFDEHCELAQLLVIAYYSQEHAHMDDTILTEIEELLDKDLNEDGAPVEDSYLKSAVHKKLDKILH